MSRRLVVLVTVAVTVPTPAASADIGIRSVSPSRARAGDVVRITAGGYLGTTRRAYPIVMVEARRAPLPYSCMKGTAVCTPAFLPQSLRRPPFLLVGTIRRWQRVGPRSAGHGRATLRFRLPRVAPGLYVFGLFCGSCTRGPKGSLIIGDDALRVVR